MYQKSRRASRRFAAARAKKAIHRLTRVALIHRIDRDRQVVVVKVSVPGRSEMLSVDLPWTLTPAQVCDVMEVSARMAQCS
jgi:hypothetical protein